MWFFDWLFRRNKPKKIKLGLALGSGGAKGFAELGAIHAFEENGIEFDLVAGTSIGSIVGACYADGYTSTDIVNILNKVDANEITNTFMINMNTSGLHKVIDRTLGSKNIEDLKKPFKTIATDVETGDGRVFDKGNVAIALCASSCFPPFFKPVVIEEKRYVDGAFYNSVPADLVKEMGADYIVGIDLADHEAKPSLLLRIIPTFKSKIKEPWEKGYSNSNVMLHPDLSGYKSTSFGAGQKMYEIGYNTAMEAMAQIKEDIEKLRFPKRKKKCKKEKAKKHTR